MFSAKHTHLYKLLSGHRTEVMYQQNSALLLVEHILHLALEKQRDGLGTAIRFTEALIKKWFVHCGQRIVFLALEIA